MWRITCHGASPLQRQWPPSALHIKSHTGMVLKSETPQLDTLYKYGCPNIPKIQAYPWSWMCKSLSVLCTPPLSIPDLMLLSQLSILFFFYTHNQPAPRVSTPYMKSHSSMARRSPCLWQRSPSWPRGLRSLKRSFRLLSRLLGSLLMLVSRQLLVKLASISRVLELCGWQLKRFLVTSCSWMSLMQMMGPYLNAVKGHWNSWTRLLTLHLAGFHRWFTLSGVKRMFKNG